MRKVDLKRGVTLSRCSPPKSTYASVCMRKIWSLSEPTALSDCLATIELTQPCKPKCLYEEKLARLGGWPYYHKRLTHLQLSHLFVSCVNGLLCFVSNCMKSSIVQSSAVALVTLYYPGKVFSARSARFWETCTSSMAALQIPGKIVLNLNFHLALVLS